MGVLALGRGHCRPSQRALLLIATLAVALLNGFSLSPVFDWADYMLGVVLRGYP